MTSCSTKCSCALRVEMTPTGLLSGEAGIAFGGKRG